MDTECQRFNKYVLNNTLLFSRSQYQGIPSNIIVNIILFLILVILFLFIRKVAWRYSQIALLDGSDSEQIFFTHLFYGNASTLKTVPATNREENQQGSENAVRMAKSLQTGGFFSWIGAFCGLSDDDLAAKAGKDAIRYSKFQRYVLVYCLIVSVVALAVVLPVNIMGGGDNRNAGQFSRITINNVHIASPTLWVHSILTGVYMLIAIAFMYHYNQYVMSGEVSKYNPRCLMLSHVPQRALDEQILLIHFKEAYPTTNVISIELTYDIKELQQLQTERSAIVSALRLCESSQKQSGISPQVTNCRFTWLCKGCCCGSKDAIQYYTAELEVINNKIQIAESLTRKKKLPNVFVTFETAAEATLVERDFRSSRGFCGLFGRSLAASSVSVSIRPHKWIVKRAPFPDDINWAALRYAHTVFWLVRAVCINIVIFVFLFFCSTPFYVFKLLQIDSLNMQSNILALFMWVFTFILPYIVYFSDRLIGHWTKSKEHFSVMIKCYIFQVLMILVLPSFGMAKFGSLFKLLFSETDNEFVRAWSCVFVPENASFYINFIITTAFMGNMADLLRIGEMILYFVHWLGARSKAESKLIFKKVLWEYEYGFNLSYMLLIFAIVITYANIAPLIVVFGLLYFILKMLVDRYNLYFAYIPSVMDRSVHRLAQSCMLFSVLLAQIFVAGYFLYMNMAASYTADSRTIFLLACIVLSLGYIFSRFILHLLRNAECFIHDYEVVSEHSPLRHPAKTYRYVPDALLCKADETSCDHLDASTSSSSDIHETEAT